MTVRDSYTNIATQIVDGIDYKIRCRRDFGPGSIRFKRLADSDF